MNPNYSVRQKLIICLHFIDTIPIQPLEVGVTFMYIYELGKSSMLQPTDCLGFDTKPLP